MTAAELLAQVRSQKAELWLDAGRRLHARGNVSRTQWKLIVQMRSELNSLLVAEADERGRLQLAATAPPAGAEAVRDEPAATPECDAPAPVAAAPAEPELLPRWRWKQCGLYEVMDNGQLVVAHRLGREHAERILHGEISPDDAEASEREHHQERLTEEMYFDLRRQRRGIRPPEPIPLPWRTRDENV